MPEETVFLSRYEIYEMTDVTAWGRGSRDKNVAHSYETPCTVN